MVMNQLIRVCVTILLFFKFVILIIFKNQKLIDIFDVLLIVIQTNSE